MIGRRVVAATVLLAGLVAMVAVGRTPAVPVHPVFTTLGRPTMPFVPGGNFVTSSWFCPGVPRGAQGVGGSVIVVNPSDGPLNGSISVFTDEAGVAPVTQDFVVEARARNQIDLLSLQPQGTFVSALVEVQGGGGFVEQQADHPAGSAVAPCANSTSSDWYFADGFTLEGSTEQLIVTNPFPDDAILNFEFATNEGTRQPSRLQGFPVKGNSVAVITQESLPRDEATLAVSVHATRGRVVVARAQQYLGAGRLGYTLSLGAPSLSDQYFFADGEIGPGIIERYTVYNGSDRDVAVQAVFLGVPASDQFANDTELTVPAKGVVSLQASEVPGLPEGRHGAVFSTLGESSIVVERAITRPAGDSVATSVVMGSPAVLAGPRWSMAIGSDLAVENILVVLNVDGVDATVTVKALGPGGEVAVPGMEAIVLPAGGVTAIGISDPAALARPLVIESTSRIYVERLLPRNVDLRGRSGSFALAG